MKLLNIKLHSIEDSLLKACPYSEFFWSVFLRIRTEYGEIQSISPLRIQSECGKIRTRQTPNTDNFQAIYFVSIFALYNNIRRQKVVKLIIQPLQLIFSILSKYTMPIWWPLCKLNYEYLESIHCVCMYEYIYFVITKNS